MMLRAPTYDDLTAVVALMNACDVADTGEPDTSEDDIAAGWRESRFDLARDAWLVEDEAGVVGYAEAYERSPGAVIETDVHVLPERRGEAIEQLLLDHALWRAAAMAGGSGAVASTWCPEHHPNRPVLEAAGFAPARLVLRMRIDLDGTQPPPQPPPGIELRPFRVSADEAAVHAALVEAFTAHVRPITDTLPEFVEKHVDHPDFDPELWSLAWDGDEVAGAIVAFDHGDLGFVRDVGVRAPWRGRGVATALLRRTFALLTARGQHCLDLGVDADDPVGAARLYERLGFRMTQRLDLMERPL